MRPTHNRANSHRPHGANNANAKKNGSSRTVAHIAKLLQNSSARLTRVKVTHLLDVRLVGTFVAVALVVTAVCVRTFRVEASGNPAGTSVVFSANSPIGQALNGPVSQSKQFSMLRSMLLPELAAASPVQPGNAPFVGEVTLTATAGTATGSFTTLGAAFTAINAGTHQGAIVISVNANTAEGATTATLNASGAGAASYTSISIQPAGGAARTISGNPAGPLIDLNGADNVTIDGLNTGGNSLTIDNTLAATTPSTIRFMADATTNIVQNCTIKSAETSTTLGTIFFSTGTASGNDGNIITGNTITSSGANFATNAIFSLGTSAAIDNSGNTISSNNISDYFNAAAATVGINLAATGNSGWTIQNNKLFQTALRLYTTATTHNGISIGVGSGYTITGNTIGFASSSGTGLTTMVGNSVNLSGTFPSAWNNTGTPNATRYIAINAAFTAAGAVSNIQGNTIAGFALYSNSGATTTNGIWCGISVTSGNVNIGTTTGNTIGATSGQGSVYTAANTAGGTAVGIFVTSANTVSIQNNAIGAVDAAGAVVASGCGGITGIDVAGAGVFTISGNFIGNTTANNLRAGNLATGATLANTGTFVTTTGVGAANGIRSSATGGPLNITGNTLRGFAMSSTSSSASSTFTGITNTGAATSAININGNFLGTAAVGLLNYAFAIGASSALTGINSSAGAAAAPLSISTNDIRGIVHSAAGANTHTYISLTHGNSVTDTVNLNTFTNLNVNTTGSVTFLNRGTTSMTSGGVTNITNNSIVTAFNKGGAGGTVTFLNTGVGDTSPAGTTFNETGNNFSNITLTGATAVAGWSDVNGPSGGGVAKTITGNTFSSISTGSASVTIIAQNFGGNGTTVSNNTISNVTNAPTTTGLTLTGISIGSSSGGATHTVANNAISGLSSTGTGGQNIGILGGSTTITTFNISANTVSGISSTSTAGPVVSGIFNNATGTTVNIFKNKVYDVVCSPGAVIGINSTASAAGNTINVYNNIVGRLYASTSAFFQAARGLLLQGTVAATFNVYFNTVYLDGTTPTQTYCVYIGSTVNNVPNVNAIDNIFVNNVTSSNGSTLPNTVYFRFGTTDATDLASTTNNNLLYGGTPAVDHLIYVDGAVGALTNPKQTLASYQALVTPRESASKTELPPFLNTTNGSLANYLHISSLATQVKNGGIPIIGFTDDFDGDTRNASTPDMGADEVTTFQFSSASYSVAENVGGGLATITVTRTAGTGNSGTVQYATSNGSATGGASCTGSNDYVNASNTLSFAAGETSKTFDITICPDTTYEANETVNLTLSTATGSILGTPSSATLTITNDDTAPSFSINDVSHNEGDAGTTNYTFTVTKTGSTALNSTVDYATADDSATQPSDYTQATATTLTFLPADTTKQFTILVNGDTTFEADEQFFANLSNATGATISDSQGIGTITNDDGAPGTLVVTKTADTNGTCVIGNCSLREAINAANSNSGDANTINFNIPNTDPNFSGGVYVITPLSQLPALTSSITIDGTSQTTFGGDTNGAGPEVQLSGAFIATQPIPFNFVDGLILSGGNDVVKGLIINGFNTTGFFNRGILINSSNNTVRGNYIGTNASGTAAVGNGDGIRIDSNSTGNTIGGSVAGQGNVISGNTARGVVIQGASAGSVVQGNFIGTNAGGTAAVANQNAGVEIADGSSTNAIGAATAGARNVISGNMGDGVKIGGTITFSNNVQGNYIGTNAAGTAAIGNAAAGVRISDAAGNNHIGGLSAGVRNIISGNGSGVIITGAGTSSNHVEGNYIGTDVTGTSSIGNLEAGVDISGGATNNFVGDADASARNVISGNSGALGTPAGVIIRDPGTNGNTVQSNYIGVAPDGSTALGNTGGGSAGSQGVFIKSGAANNIIGGSDPANEGNIIANNTGDGVRVWDDAASIGSTSGNSIRGNSIYNNTKLGINLFKAAEADGVVTPNDVQDTDNGPNGLQNFPIITTAVAGSTTVSGTLNSTATAAFTIDVYSNASCDSSGNGEGATYLGSVTTGNTNGSGDVNWSVTVPALVSGQILTATATSSTGNSSELSACYAAAAACTPPSTVYVDDSWVGTPLGTDPDMGGPATNFGCDSFATIQDGVNGVTAGGTVIVNAGNYVENVAIPKALTLTGAGAASVFLRPAVSNPNCGGAGGGSLCAGGSNLILVQADNVTISGLTLDGDNTTLTSGEVFGGADIDARNGIITNHLAGVFNNLEVHHTTIKNIWLRGVYASSSGSFNFHDNTVQNVQASVASIGMFNFAGAGSFTNNNVSLCNDAISSNHSRGTTYTGNTVTTSASGIHTDNAGDSGGTNDTISANTVTNGGYGIWVFVPYKTVNVQNNNVTNMDVGYAVFGDSGVTTSTAPEPDKNAVKTEPGRVAPVSVNVIELDSALQRQFVRSPMAPNAPPAPPYAASFTGNTADGQNKANSTGVYFSTNQLGFGSGNPKVKFFSNTVLNNVDGFFLEAETGFTLETAASFNRIVNNTGSQVTQNTGAGFAGTLNGSMENNWWGCNAGPGNTGCGVVIGAGVDFNPWIVLGISASPATIPPGGSSTITADMTHNSANAVPSVTDFVPQVAVTFGATNGTVFPTSGTITNGQATTTFTSNSTSSGTASATVDNQTVNTPVNVTAANTYTWSPTVGTDWINPLNWTPARILPQTNDNLVINGITTPAPIITSVPTQTIAGLHLINAPSATLQSSGAATLTISGATGADLTVPAGSFLTLDGANALSIKLMGAGTLGTVGGGVAAQGGFHRLFGDTNGDITIQSGGIATAGPGLTTNMFGTGAVGDGAAGSVIFANGSSYFHNAGGSPFGTSPNPAVAVFQTGSLATFLTASGFEANGRTYADLTIGKADPGGVAVTASDSGAGNFQFDNLTLNSTSSATSSLSYTGSGASTITIRGNISSTGAGNTGTLPDVTLTAGTGGTHVDKIGGGTLILSTTGNARSIDLEGGATVENGTILSLARVVLLGLSNPHLNTLTVNATAGISGGSNGYVVGGVKKFAISGSFSFPVGTVGAYSPVDLANASGGDLTVVARTPQQPVLNAATSLQRYWTLTEGGTLTTDLTFHYLDGDVAGNEGNYRIVAVEAGNATSFPADANHSVNAGANTFTALGIQSFSDWTVAEPNAPTAVQLASFNAIRTDNEVMVQWRSGYEARNLGYNIYREQNGVRTRITPSLVAGSALTAGMQTEARAGFTYTWYDEVAKGKGHSAESSQNGNVTYWLEDVDLNGVKTLHGPIAPSIAYAAPKSARTARSDMISEVNASSSHARGSGVFYNGWVSDRPPLSASVANPNAIAVQRDVEMRGGIKISIKKDGWYRITQPQLIAAGLDPNANMPQLQLYANGRAVPIRQSGDEVHLTPTDYIEFYARGVTSPTDAVQTYYLVLADTFGLRIHDLEYRNPDPLPAPSGPTGFDYTVERQERMIYFSSLQNGDLENFFGQIVSSTAASSTLPVTNLDPAAVQAGTPAQLEVTLQGVTNEAHQVKVKLNGTEVGTINFANTGHPVETFDIAPGMLLNGNNTVELSSQNGASDVSLVDTLRLTYTHTFTAESNLLSLNMADESVKRVGGFTSDNIRVLDITDPQRVEEITRTVEVNPEAGGSTYSVDMRVLGASFRQPHTLLAFTADGEAPAAVAKNNASDLWNQNTGADYVMITTGALKDSIEPLAQFRRSQGLVVNMVDVEDLYDEFSFGLHTPQAIRDYLQGAMTNWTRKPRYVLFAGDASYDPKNYFNLGMNDLVPTKLIDTSLSETASDDWLVDFDNDGLADISIGRLPVRTVASANVIVNKIINYENSVPEPARGAMLVSDTSFVTASGTIQSLLPNGLPVENINRGTSDDATIHNQIVASLNQGPRVANYFGHGSHGVWTGASLLSSNDAPSLTNSNHLTVFTMMTCLNGIFQDAVNESLSEALLKSQGGAVAVWASSGFTEPTGQITIDQEFYRLIFAAQPATLGDASRAAKATTSDPDVRRTWTLFGDPAMKIR